MIEKCGEKTAIQIFTKMITKYSAKAKKHTEHKLSEKTK